MKFSELLEFDNSIELDHGEIGNEVLGLTSFDRPKSHHLVFVKDRKFLGRLIDSLNESSYDEIETYKTMTVLVQKAFLEKLRDSESELLDSVKESFLMLATCKDVFLAMSYLSKPFYSLKFGELNDLVDGRQMGTSKVHPTAWIGQNVFIGESVVIGEDVKIYPGSVILSKVTIGDGSVIMPNVTIYPYTLMGKLCRIHSGVVIGADGFGYNFDGKEHKKVWHLGGVEIGDNVEIGANSAIDMGTFSPTIIGSGSKIDNQVQIGHNTNIGNGVIMCGQAGSAGSSSIGHFCVMGGRSGITNDVTLGDGSQVAGGGMVSQNWEAGSVLGGHPARPLKEWMRSIAFLRKLSKR